MGFFQSLLGTGVNKEEIKALISSGATVLDVRSVEEFNSGNLKGSVNIPLHLVPTSIDKIKAMNGPIVTVCRSGNRSGQAERFLKQQGIQVVNGGPWNSI